MMYNYPFLGFPGFRRNYYYSPNYYSSKYYRPNSNVNKSTNNETTFNTKKESTFSSCIPKEDKKVDFSCDDNYYSDSECFNIFGLSLHIDDLLILALLFFLYKEDSDDMYLYVALFLLLLS